MANTGSNLEKNPFEKAMKSSISNACEISAKTLHALQAQSTTDTRINDEAVYLKPYDNALQEGGVNYLAAFESRTGASKTLKTFEKGIPAEVDAWWRKLTDVYDEGTPQYNVLWGHGNTWFYHNSRTINLAHMNALVTNIGTDAALATLKTRVQGFITTYQAKIDTQSGDKSVEHTDTSTFDQLVADSTIALHVVYCGLVRIFPGNLSQVTAFFPMELIYHASKMREYRKLIPKASRKKICSRKWKSTDLVMLVNNYDVDLNVGLAVNKVGEVASWYTLAAGVSVTVAPSVLGNVALKSLIVQNNDIANQGDITVTIKEA